MPKNTFLLIFIFLTGTLCAAAQDNPEEKYALKARPLLTQCESLSETDNAAVTAALKSLGSADAAGKIRLLGELSKSCHRKSIEPIVLVLQDKDPLVRQAAVEALGHLGSEDAIDPLIEMAKDPDWRVRFSVGTALCAFQKQRSSYAALNHLAVVQNESGLKADDVRARCHTMLQINQLRDVNFSRKTFMFLFGLLESKDEAIVKLATETMHAMKDTRNGQFELIGMLKQSINPNYRRNASYWLGQLKIEKGRWLLTEVAATDTDETVKKTAAEALKLLGSTDEEPPADLAKPKAIAKGTKTASAVKAAPKATAKKPVKK
ncbi:MAG TPA: HEAT repeat domain-containing protein [Blastocatellia bacterium]|nr:HEAT repeat domain-containing protein [Blastocatellia bacterium]